MYAVVIGIPKIQNLKLKAKNHNSKFKNLKLTEGQFVNAKIKVQSGRNSAGWLILLLFYGA